ncbi:hypothetical protein QCN27_16300 [Cereibacter sp. SYSU M97828]|nr:hypothetical protein [Cereibacter flavus]
MTPLDPKAQGGKDGGMDLLISQLTDPFRIGLLVALVLTTLRNAAISGVIVPLLAGIVFVAVIIPVTMEGGADPIRIAVGLASNAIILAVVLGLRALALRLRAR